MKKVKKRILSTILSLAVMLSVVTIVSTEAKASDAERKSVDGSYFISEESSVGYTSSPDMRGQYLMTGECSITKAGLTRIYCYGSTTANFDVDYIATLVYVDQYQEDVDQWWQIDYWYVSDHNDCYISTGKTLKVDRGYYYRVHADHIVKDGEDGYEENYSVTDGIRVP